MNTLLIQALAHTLALRSSIVLMLLCSFFVVSNLHAQDETQAPFDREGNIFVITGDMAREYNLFPDYPNLTDARLFQLKDSSFVLELTQMLSGTPQRTRLAMDIWKVLDLRNRLATIVNAQVNTIELRLNDWEKTGLTITSTLIGAYYGVVIDASTRSAQSGTTVGIATIATPLVFGAATLAAAAQPWFNRTSRQMLNTGLIGGALHGALLSVLFSETLNTVPVSALAPMLSMSVAEAVGGVWLANTLHWNYGQSTVITSLSASGLATGLALSTLAGGLVQTNVKALSAASLLSAGAGYYVGHLLTNNNPSWANGDGDVFATPALLGAILPFSVAYTSNGGVDANAVIGLSVATHVLGYVLGATIVNDKDFSYNQGRSITEATALGLIPGLIVGLAVPNGWRYTPLVSVIGGAIGFGISYAILAPQAEQQARDNAARRTSRGGQTLLQHETTWLDEFAASDFMRNTDVQFTPLGLAGLAVPNLLPLGASMPILSVRHTFTAPINTVPTEH